MNLENFKNITSPIETENPREKKEALFKKISQISLIYADKKFKELALADESYKFSQALQEFTPVKDIILRPLFALERFNHELDETKIDKFLEETYREIDLIYNNKTDLSKVEAVIESRKSSIKAYFELEGRSEADQRPTKTKLLNFNDINSIESDADGHYSDLDKFGFSKSDHFIELHVEDFYDSGQKNLGPDLIKNDLGVIAEHIIDEVPETAALVGRSWLLDTPLTKRLGFNKIDTQARSENDFSTWLQFVDKTGQIDDKRFKEFLETEKLPYKSVRAYIKTEDFLKKYLPDNRRGKITLREVDLARSDFWLEFKKEASSVKADWRQLLETSGDFSAFIRDNKKLNQILEFLSPEDQAEYLEFFKIMYNSNIFWEDFSEHKSDKIIDIDKKINTARQNDLYKNKEVFID